jgi:putative CocE/NonD family hydrolase
MSAGAGVGRIPGASSQGLFYRGGVPMISTWSVWYAPFGYKWRPKLPVGRSDEEVVKDMRNFTVSSPDFFDASYNKALGESVRMAPSHDILQRLNVPATDFERLMAGGPTDPDWNNVDFITAEDTGTTPSLNINGWYDVGVYETIKLFEFQQNQPDQYLIMAPSAHCQMTKTDENAKVGDRPIGDSRFPYVDVQMAWFDRWLKKDPTAWKPTPKVQAFLMGANTWLTGDHWPLKQTRRSRLFLSGEGNANTLDGDGQLLPAARGPDQSDHFAYDPDDPTPTVGGGMLGAVSADQRSVERRPDVLVYSTPALKRGLAFVGDIRAVLFVSVDTADTDVAVKLLDVYPDGTAYNVQDSILRLSHRNGLPLSGNLKPGQVYRIEVSDMVTSNYFAPGHRVRIEVAGADFPNSDRNWNTGGRNDLATSGSIAHVEIHHGAKYPSHLEFTEYVGPIPPRSSGPTPASRN